MLLKSLISVCLFASLTTQSFAVEDEKDESELSEKAAGKEGESPSPLEDLNPINLIRYLHGRARSVRVNPSTYFQEESLRIHEESLRSEIERLKTKLLEVIQEKDSPSYRKLGNLDELCLQIQERLSRLMKLHKSLEEESDVQKLASFLRNFYALTGMEHEIGIIVNRSNPQVLKQFRDIISILSEVQIGDQRKQLRGQIWTERGQEWDEVLRQIGLLRGGIIDPQVLAQITSVLSSNFNFSSGSLDENYNNTVRSTLRVCIRYTIIMYLIDRILWLLSPEAQFFKEKIEAILSQHLTLEQISQILRSFQIPLDGDCPLDNLLLAILRTYIPSPAMESQFSLLTGLVAAVAISSASSF